MLSTCSPSLVLVTIIVIPEAKRNRVILRSTLSRLVSIIHAGAGSLGHLVDVDGIVTTEASGLRRSVEVVDVLVEWKEEVCWEHRMRC